MKRTLLFMALAMVMLTGCQHSPKADIVVYGNIYTAEDNQIVEAFAVKDGKFVYVGDKAGAETFVKEGKTEVVDYSGNAHALYSVEIAKENLPRIQELMWAEGYTMNKAAQELDQEGKYADFLLVTKDVLTCPVNEIHEAKPTATYFEGKKVYPHL